MDGQMRLGSLVAFLGTLLLGLLHHVDGGVYAGTVSASANSTGHEVVWTNLGDVFTGADAGGVPHTRFATATLKIADDGYRAVSASISGASVAGLFLANLNVFGEWELDLGAFTLADGVYTIDVATEGVAGHLSSSILTFQLDTRLPLVAIATPADGSHMQVPVAVAVGAYEMGARLTAWLSGPSLDRAELGGLIAHDDGAWEVRLADIIQWDGEYTLELEAEDFAGNRATATSVFTIDRVAPVLTLEQPAEGAAFTSGDIVLYGRAEGHALLEASLRAEPDGESTSLTTRIVEDGQGGWTLDLANLALADGVYVVEILAADLAGNTTATTRRFVLDGTAPAITFTSPMANEEVASRVVRIAGQTEPGAMVALYLGVGAPLFGTTNADSTGTWYYDVEFDVDGLHEVLATATDVFGNTSAPVAVTFVRNVDQCLVSTENNCDPNAACINTSTGFACVCSPWFIDVNNDGTLCPRMPIELEIMVPARGAVLATRDLVVTGLASEGTRVTLTLDGNLIGDLTPDSAGAWRLTHGNPLADGTYTLEATVTRPDGATTSVLVNFTVDVTGPTVSISAPLQDELLRDIPDAVIGQAEPGARVALELDGVALGAVTSDGQGNWALAFAQDMLDGAHGLVAVATDAVGNRAGTAVTFILDRSRAVDILTPADGSEVRTLRPTVTGKAELGLTVALFAGDEQVADVQADDNGNWQWVAESDFAEGPVRFLAQTTSVYGLTTSDEVAVVLVNPAQPMSVTIDSPADGSFVRLLMPTFRGSAAPNSSVRLVFDEAPAGIVWSDANGQWLWAPRSALSQGPHTLTAWPADGEETMSDSVTVVVDSQAPRLTGAIELLDEEQGLYRVFGEGEPGLSVTLTLNGGDTPVAAVGVDAEGRWSTEIVELEVAWHTVRGESADAAGNKASVEIPFQVVRPVYIISGGGTACRAANQDAPAGLANMLAIAGLAALGLRARRRARERAGA